MGRPLRLRSKEPPGLVSLRERPLCRCLRLCGASLGILRPPFGGDSLGPPPLEVSTGPLGRSQAGGGLGPSDLCYLTELERVGELGGPSLAVGTLSLGVALPLPWSSAPADLFGHLRQDTGRDETLPFQRRYLGDLQVCAAPPLAGGETGDRCGQPAPGTKR
jgi:hypothetical protein